MASSRGTKDRIPEGDLYNLSTISMSLLGPVNLPCRLDSKSLQMRGLLSQAMFPSSSPGGSGLLAINF